MKTDRGENLLSVPVLRIYLLTLISKRRNIISPRAELIFSVAFSLFSIDKEKGRDKKNGEGSQNEKGSMRGYVHVRYCHQGSRG